MFRLLIPFLILPLLLLAPATLRAEPPDRPSTAPRGHEAAARAYSAGDWAGTEAALPENDPATWKPETLLLLGHARARQGKAAEAMLSYRRALAMKPGYPEAAQNLSVLSRRQGVLEARPPDPMTAFLLAIAPGWYDLATALSLWSILGGILALLLFRHQRPATLGIILATCGGIGLVLTASAHIWKERMLRASVDSPPAVWFPDGQVMEETPLFAEPARDAPKVVQSVPAGTPLRLVKQEAWSYVEIPSGPSGPPLRGWLRNPSWLPLRTGAGSGSR